MAMVRPEPPRSHPRVPRGALDPRARRPRRRRARARAASGATPGSRHRDSCVFSPRRCFSVRTTNRRAFQQVEEKQKHAPGLFGFGDALASSPSHRLHPPLPRPPPLPRSARTRSPRARLCFPAFPASAARTATRRRRRCGATAPTAPRRCATRAASATTAARTSPGTRPTASVRANPRPPPATTPPPRAPSTRPPWPPSARRRRRLRTTPPPGAAARGGTRACSPSARKPPPRRTPPSATRSAAGARAAPWTRGPRAWTWILTPGRSSSPWSARFPSASTRWTRLARSRPPRGTSLRVAPDWPGASAPAAPRRCTTRRRRTWRGSRR